MKKHPKKAFSSQISKTQKNPPKEYPFCFKVNYIINREIMV